MCVRVCVSESERERKGECVCLNVCEFVGGGVYVCTQLVIM